MRGETPSIQRNQYLKEKDHDDRNDKHHIRLE